MSNQRFYLTQNTITELQHLVERSGFKKKVDGFKNVTYSAPHTTVSIQPELRGGVPVNYLVIYRDLDVWEEHPVNVLLDSLRNPTEVGLGGVELKIRPASTIAVLGSFRRTA